MTIYRGQGGLGDSYNDPELVHTSGDETIEGVKTFTSTIIGTVSGHYTKAEEDAKLALKANQSTTFTKTEVSALVDAKADQATTYTKTEVDTALSGKLSSADGSVTYAKLSTDLKNATYGFKNRIINGAMTIDQRNEGAAVTNASAYIVDRWGDFMVGSGRYTAQRSTTAPAGFVNSFQHTVTTAVSPAAGDVYQLFQMIEGNNVADLAFGTANAQTITVSFWVRSSVTGTYAFRLQNSAASRTYIATYTVNSANTFEYKTVTIVGDTSGTWLTDIGIGLGINFDLGSGSNFNGTAGAWASADARRTSGCVNWIATNGATFYITGVQLEKGSTATSFDYRPYGTELALCQRYYYKFALRNVGLTGNSTDLYNGAIQFPTTMRSAPTLDSGATFTPNSGTAGTVTLRNTTGVPTTQDTVTVYNSTANWTGANIFIAVSAGLTAEL